MIRYRYDEKKATQAASYLLKKAGGRMNYMKLMKLLYIANRETLKTKRYPLIKDRYVSMKHGPVLSGVLDSINEQPTPGADGYWSTMISAPMSYDVELLSHDIGLSELSNAELEILDRTWEQFRHMGAFEVRDYCHDNLPEWQNPGSSSMEIPLSRILHAVGFHPEDIREIEEEEAVYQSERSGIVTW